MLNPSERERFRDLYDHESARTQKVLRAYPPSQAGFKPHERLNSAEGLAGTFCVEQHLILKALRGQQILGTGHPEIPKDWEGLLAAFDAGREEILALLRESGDEIMHGTATFFVGPKQMGDFTTEEFVTFMTHDQIHHRGQLSVYLRLAGGKVPAIYGPSADEPWT